MEETQREAMHQVERQPAETPRPHLATDCKMQKSLEQFKGGVPQRERQYPAMRKFIMLWSGKLKWSVTGEYLKAQNKKHHENLLTVVTSEEKEDAENPVFGKTAEDDLTKQVDRMMK
uniref:Uncharacterized protein n=1 Tax=Branchiostoma floridae TaxID=7739 RepID=C3ZQM0_BRAFL|eukprot:XP_002589265.1 hypothetical protein BRAFLDRAFT_74578 [Branchiostoma floridae]